MQTPHTIKALLKDIAFRDWKFNFGLKNRTPYLQIIFEDACHFGGPKELQHCRKWMLSYHMTDSEIVQTAFKAVMTAVEHETRELFKFKSARVYQPHFDVHALVEFARSGNISIRPKLKSVDSA